MDFFSASILLFDTKFFSYQKIEPSTYRKWLYFFLFCFSYCLLFFPIIILLYTIYNLQLNVYRLLFIVYRL